VVLLSTAQSFIADPEELRKLQEEVDMDVQSVIERLKQEGVVVAETTTTTTTTTAIDDDDLDCDDAAAAANSSSVQSSNNNKRVKFAATVVLESHPMAGHLIIPSRAEI